MSGIDREKLARVFAQFGWSQYSEYCAEPLPDGDDEAIRQIRNTLAPILDELEAGRRYDREKPPPIQTRAVAHIEWRRCQQATDAHLRRIRVMKEADDAE